MNWTDHPAVAKGDPDWGDILVRDDVNLIIRSYENPMSLTTLRDADAWCLVNEDDVALIYSQGLNTGYCIHE